MTDKTFKIIKVSEKIIGYFFTTMNGMTRIQIRL